MKNEKLIIAIKAAADAASAESRICGFSRSAFCRGKAKAMRECAGMLEGGCDAKEVSEKAARMAKDERRMARRASIDRKLRKSTYQYLCAGESAGYRESARLIGEAEW